MENVKKPDTVACLYLNLLMSCVNIDHLFVGFCSMLHFKNMR